MLKNQWSKKEIEDSEYEIHHRALSEEYSFFEAVKDGNIEAVSKNLKKRLPIPKAWEFFPKIP